MIPALLTLGLIAILAIALVAYVSRSAKRGSSPGAKSGNGDPGLFWLGAAGDSDSGHHHSGDCGHTDAGGGDGGGGDGGGGSD